MTSRYQTLYEAINCIASDGDLMEAHEAREIAKQALDKVKAASHVLQDPGHNAAIDAAEQHARKDCRSVGKSFSMFDRGLIRAAAVTALYTFMHGEQSDGQG